MHGTYVKISQKNCFMGYGVVLAEYANSDWLGKGTKTNICNDGYEP